MASCPLAATPEAGPLKVTGETWETAGLYVADGGALPTATGVNPYVSVYAVARHVALNVVRSLELENQ